MVTINIKGKNKQNIPDWLLIFMGVMTGLLIVGYVWGVYEVRADHKYYDCMYEFAGDYCGDQEIKEFSVRYSAVVCEQNYTNDNYLITFNEPITPIIMNEKEIGICWNRSRSLWYQLFP